jgi:molybdate transport system ATP-binding protein
MTLAVDLRARRGDFTVEAAFAIQAGRTAAVVGPNGSGKTTLIAALAGLLPIERGTIRFEERTFDDTATMTHAAPGARGIGLMPQDGLLFPHMTLLENVAFPLRARRTPHAESLERARVWLERMAIAHRAGARARDLSGGEARRAALARALIGEPRILLLDEPFAGLDIDARADLQQLLWQAVESFSGVRLIVTHDPEEALAHADQLIVLENGTVIQSGTVNDIKRDPRSSFIASFLERRGETGPDL